MFKKKKFKPYQDITFVARDEMILKGTEPPKPARLLIPDWYKNIPSHHSKTPEWDDRFGNANSTLKQCMPFFDTFTMGYIMTTPCDIYVESSFNGASVKVSSHPSFNIVGTRGPGGKTSMPIPDEYYDCEFTWLTHWEAKTPPGYSTLYTHPLNKDDLPIHTVSGVMDTDHWYATGNHPFFIKKGFEGIIPMGTPMMQVIPFKRESWRATEPRAMSREEYDLLNMKVRRHISSGYKKEMWQKKEYI